MAEPSDLISIASKGLSAKIDPLGAQLFSLQDEAGRDLLWNGDPAVWNGRAPILFPIVGMLANGQYRLDGKTYSMPKHGFARHTQFQAAKTTSSAAVFQLRANKETLKVYPFRFELDVAFTLHDLTLEIAASITNLEDNPMPASFGFHPAFRWPLPYGRKRSAHTLQFEDDEPAPIRRIDHDGLLRDKPQPTPVHGCDLVLRDDLFVDDALIFDRLRSRRLRYSAGDGPHLDIKFPDAAYLGVWTKPHADFICVEPWWGIADPVGFDGDFRQKPGVFEIPPGQAKRVSMAITLKL